MEFKMNGFNADYSNYCSLFSISKGERLQGFRMSVISLTHAEVSSTHSRERGSNFNKDSLNLSLVNSSVVNFRSVNKMYNPILFTNCI